MLRSRNSVCPLLSVNKNLTVNYPRASCAQNRVRIMRVQFRGRCHQNYCTHVYVQGMRLLVDEGKVNRIEQPARAHVMCVYIVFAHASRFSCVQIFTRGLCEGLVLFALKTKGHARTPLQKTTRVARFGAVWSKITKTQGCIEFW